MSNKEFSKIVQDCLIMVSYSCGQYRGYLRDKTLTGNITERKNAKSGTHRVNRQLFCDKEGPLYQANKHADKIRNWFYTWSFPWLDVSGDSSNYRVVSLSVWMEKKKELDTRIVELKALWEKFFNQYESLVESDMRDQGTSGDSRDYKSVSELRSKFFVDVQITRVPVGGSVMMNALDNELDKLLKEQSKHDQKIVESLISNVWSKMQKPLDDLASKLTDPDYGFKDATIKDIALMCDTMRGFNITKDANIELILKEIEERILCGYKPSRLIEDPELLKSFSDTFRPKKKRGSIEDRNDLVKDAKDISKQMTNII